jgi:hypothetical protein
MKSLRDLLFCVLAAALLAVAATLLLSPYLTLLPLPAGPYWLLYTPV